VIVNSHVGVIEFSYRVAMMDADLDEIQREVS